MRAIRGLLRPAAGRCDRLGILLPSPPLQSLLQLLLPPTPLRRRGISSRAARSLLGLPGPDGAAATPPLSLAEVRQAYFQRAKECHPDVRRHDAGGDDDDGAAVEAAEAAAHREFLQLTVAYETLQAELAGRGERGPTVTETEEQAFRAACAAQLGLPAETVEECKANPLFREWLGGRTDSAHTWRNFLTQHGGLAPRLRSAVAGAIGAGSGAATTAGATSRRKRR